VSPASDPPRASAQQGSSEGKGSPVGPAFFTVLIVTGGAVAIALRRLMRVR
jgi:hypothetical protein